jgi:hypothetical protein
MSLNSTRAYEYVFSTASVYSEDISSGFYAACIRLGSSLIGTLAATLTIAIYVLILTLKLAIMIFPHLLSTSQAVIDFHRTKLTYYDALVEFLVITLFILFLLLRKRAVNQWKIFVKYVGRKSKAAADAAPHVAFFTFALVFSVMARKFLVHLTTPSVLPVMTLMIPIYTTLSALRLISSESSGDLIDSLRKQKILKQKVTLWVVLAAYHTVATGLALIPFSAWMSYIMPSTRTLAVVVIIWVQLSHNFTDIVFDASVPFLKYLARNIPSSNFGAAQGSSLISLLKMMRLLSPKSESFLKSLQQDTVIVLLASIFVFCPWRISYIGVILVSLLFPAFKSSNSILPLRGGQNVDDQKAFWLEYWVCWALLWCLRCYGFHIWPSVLLISALWLQHSYFRGAACVFSSVRFNVAAVMVRHQAILEEKSRLLYEGEGEGIDGCIEGQRVSEEETVVIKPPSVRKQIKNIETGVDKSRGSRASMDEIMHIRDNRKVAMAHAEEEEITSCDTGTEGERGTFLKKGTKKDI